MDITKKQFEKIVKESVSKSEVCRKLGIAGNGTGLRKITELSKQYSVDISHFSHRAAMSKSLRKYNVVVKRCPICGTQFEAQEGHPKEKVTCSHGCSNTFFAEKRNIPSRYSRYTTICFKKWPKKCVLCGYDKIVSVHHIDENHSNNHIDNLVPLCMNCHGEIHHSQYGTETSERLHKVLRGVA